MWTALYLPKDISNKLTKNGFETEDLAWDYVKEHLCSDCLDELNQGYYEGDFGDMEPYYINHPSQTVCGAEWMVTEEKQGENNGKS